MNGQTHAIHRRKFLKWSAAAACLGGVGGFAQEPLKAQPVPDVNERIRRMVENAPLKMRFNGKTAEQCRQWQLQFRAKLAELIGPYQPPDAWRTTVENVVELDDHHRHELVLEADGHPLLPVHLLIPKGEVRPRAGFVAVHGHGPYGYDAVVGKHTEPTSKKYINDANYDYGRDLVRRGYVVAAPCMTPFGRRLDDREAYKGQDPCGVTAVRLQLLGKLLLAENLRDVLWAFELLANHEAVDENRIGCGGLSYGGRMTMMAAAMEPRIKLAVISGALNLMQERITGRYGCGAQVIPNLLEYGDVPEIISLIAPRPCVLETGNRDSLIKEDWAQRALVRIRRAYHAYGADDRLLRDQFDGGHEWSGRVAYPLMQRVLDPGA